MEIKRSVVRQNTLECYRYYLDKHIKPYFDAKKLTLKAVTAQSIQDYYSLKLSEGQSANTICKHNVIIAGALREAKRKKFIRENPAEDVTLPSKERFIGKAYSAEDVRRLLSVLDNEEIKPAVVLGLFYGLRRSEVCGLRWQDIDFEAGKMQICNTVVKEKSLIEHEQTKSRASRRTMFLIPETVPYLEKLRIDQIALRSRMGSQWQDKQEHVCVRKDSRPFLPDYVSQGFARLLKKYQLPPLRFHELRHTAGSLLLEHGMSAKQIQEYLGHEQVSTTLDIYTHLSTAGKAETAHTMGSIFRNM